MDLFLFLQPLLVTDRDVGNKNQFWRAVKFLSKHYACFVSPVPKTANPFGWSCDTVLLRWKLADCQVLTISEHTHQHLIQSATFRSRGIFFRQYISTAIECHTCVTSYTFTQPLSKMSLEATVRGWQVWDQGRIEPPKAARGHATHIDGIVLNVISLEFKFCLALSVGPPVP